MRLLNRLGCRYLIRGDTPTLAIEAPGPDLAATTDWIAKSAEPADAFSLSDPRQPHDILKVVDGAVVLGQVAPGMEDSGTWRFVPVGDRGFYHIVNVARPDLGLTLGPKTSRDRTQYQVTLEPIGSDPATMWHVDPEACVRDARSLHLRYDAPTASDIWYNEVSPRDMPPGTYFCTSGFGSSARGIEPNGYAGIQTRQDGSRIAIFSVWHRMRDETTPDPGALATVIAASANAEKTSFGGEGSGQSIRVPLEWDDDPSSFVRFVIAAKRDARDTVLSAYVSSWGDSWLHMGTIRRARTKGRLLTGLYAFVEDFLRNGNDDGVPAARRSPYLPRRACFSNPWIRRIDSSGSLRLEPILSSKITVYSPHPLENVDVIECEGTPDRFSLLAGTGLALGTYPSVAGTTITDATRSIRPQPILPDGV